MSIEPLLDFLDFLDRPDTRHPGFNLSAIIKLIPRKNIIHVFYKRSHKLYVLMYDIKFCSVEN